MAMPMDHSNHMNMSGMEMTGMTTGSGHDHHMTTGSPSGHDHGAMPMPGGCTVQMQMFFHTGSCEYILFEKIVTSNAGQMVGACIVVFALAVCYEGLKVVREYLLQQAIVKKYTHVGMPTTSQDTIVVDPNKGMRESYDNLPVTSSRGSKDDKARTYMISLSHFIQTLLHILQVFISYCLMLIFMTYNAWLCIAVILGAGAGYFLFGWKRAVVVDVNEHCH